MSKKWELWYHVCMIKQRVCSFILALLLAAGTAACRPGEAPSPVSEAPSIPEGPAVEPGIPERESADLRYGRSFLAGEALALYDALARTAAEKTAARLPLPGGVDEAAALSVASAFLGDHPLYYWADIQLGSREEGRVLTLTPRLSPQEIDARQAVIEARAAEILAPLEGKSPFAIATGIHDAVAAIPYDRQEGPDGGNVYGALVTGKAYCNGYAAAFQYLAGEAGLPVVYIRGRSSRGVAHAWNAVKLDGAWHYVDATWDRPTSDIDDIYHDFFLLSREEMERDRIWDPSQYPALPDTDGAGFADYYRRMDYAVSGPVSDSCVSALTDIFYRQLCARPDYPAEPENVFLEFKVLGTADDYTLWKDAAVKEMFDVVRGLAQRAREEGAPFAVDARSVKANFNDNMQVITFYPYVGAAP